jgi:1,4-alpha-glucan branching enzyme
MNQIYKEKLTLVKEDPWLEPVAHEVTDRYIRYVNRMVDIDRYHGGLVEFAGIYKYLGINYSKEDKGFYYREWAPAAKALFLFGDFNGWNRVTHPLKRLDNGIWEIFLDDKTYKKSFCHLSKYKVLVHSEHNVTERIPAYVTRVVQDDYTKDFTAQLWNPSIKFDWQGDKFETLAAKDLFIYECHIGMAQEKESTGTYLEFIENVLPRVKALGYNALQIMAIAEHPYYGSFGYHVSNFFAPSSRFGTPDELKTLIREAHKMGIAVIMDIVHSHTVKNTNEGLNGFDGTVEQYFHPGERGNHPAWDSKLFNYGKIEVIQFLLSNIRYWLEEFHFDGYRFDGVTSMLYFHHGFTAFDSREKFFTDGVEYDAVTYLQLANELIHRIKPSALSIAEDVSGMPGICSPINYGGMGFDYRLGMGLPDYWIKLLKDQQDEHWSMENMYATMNDRKPDTKTITYCESHDQALVGDKTIAFRLMDQQMYWHMTQKDQDLVVDRGIAMHKLIRLMTISLGGQAYLNFMGNEFGHPEWIDFPREGNGWSHKYARRQWSLADNPDLKYKFLLEFDRQMLKVISENSVLHGGYGQKLHVHEDNKILCFEKAGLIFVFNFHIWQSLPDYELYVPFGGKFRIVLNSDSTELGGFSRIDESLDYQTYERNGASFLKIYIPNRTALVLKRVE